eukprot:IDg5735t1
MTFNRRTCRMERHYKANVPVCVQATEEWQVRISQFADGWGPQLA